MTTISDLVGVIDESRLDPLGTSASLLPRGKKERPHARYGRRGIYVVMAPVKGLTPPGVFPRNKPFAFQCPPMNEFGENGGHDFQDYAVLGKQQHSQEIGKQLRTVQFQTIFLDWEPEWALAHDDSGEYPAQQAVKDLCRIRDHGKPFHLLAHQSNFQDKYEVDYAATLRSVSWNITAGETDAYYVTVQFTEFSSPDIQQLLSGASVNPRLPASVPVANLQPGLNTLAQMAKIYFGDPSKWRVIAAKNGLSRVSANTPLSSKNVHSSKITIPALRTKAKSRGQHR